jgi:hypothetical protein
LEYTYFMKTGQPKLSVRKSQKSGFFVTPTNGEDYLPLKIVDFQLKGRITICG